MQTLILRVIVNSLEIMTIYIQALNKNNSINESLYLNLQHSHCNISSSKKVTKADAHSKKNNHIFQRKKQQQQQYA